MNTLFLRQDLAVENISTGKFDGVAYSGGVIEQHGWIKNLIIDLSTLSIAKAKTPVLRDHDQSKVAGHGLVTIGGDIRMQGQLSKRTPHGQEIVTLAEDGTEWEMSIGVYGGQLVEFKEETINGIYIAEGVKLINGLIREVSIVILGADLNTTAEVFSLFKEEIEVMKLNSQNPDWVKLACSCGGHKESTPEELEQKFKDQQKEIEDKKNELSAKDDDASKKKEEIKKKQDEADEWKKKYEAAQAEVDKMKGDTDTKVRSEAISAKAKEKNVELTAEVIAKASETKESTDLLLSFIDATKSLTPANMRGPTDLGALGASTKVDEKDAESLRLAAVKMVEEKKAKNFSEAIELLTKKEET